MQNFNDFVKILVLKKEGNLLVINKSTASCISDSSTATSPSSTLEESGVIALLLPVLALHWKTGREWCNSSTATSPSSTLEDSGVIALLLPVLALHWKRVV